MRKTLLLFVSFAIILLPAAWGQETAEISGKVYDPSGAAVTGAAVKIVSLETGLVRTGQTGEDGLYDFPILKVGRYDLEVTASGFKKFVETGLKLEVGQTARLDVPLTLGETKESVTVNGSTQILQTDSAELSDVIQGRQVVDTPLNGRNVMNLVALVPGVVPQGSASGAAVANTFSSGFAFTNPGAWGNYQMSGGFPGTNLTVVDGAPDTEPYLQNYTVLVPTQDAVQEFSVVTSNASAEFGGFTGGVINMTTKSGSNQFHGSAYEYLRNKV